LLRELLQHQESWEFVSFQHDEDVPSAFLRLHPLAA
jgi:UDP-3-O-[3-hydroxymyristoyl] N-acetylglucosamine deacetylase